MARQGPKSPASSPATARSAISPGHVSDLSGAALDPQALAKLGAIDVSSLPVVDASTRLGPCVAGTGKFICIGLNYSDHAAETGATVPPEPIIFMKATSAIVGPNDDVLIPRGSEKTDWEVELAVIIGKTAKYVSDAEALDYVAGYCVTNDVSERVSRRNAPASGPRASPATRLADGSMAGHEGRDHRSAEPWHVAEG